MGAPESDIEAGEQPAAETLLDAFKSISAAERRKHASVLNYWLSIRGDKEFPPLHDLDPLELSDAGPNSILLELISGGHDAEVRHLGEALRFEGTVDRVIDAPSPSLIACVAKKLPIVAISRDFLAFEDEYEGANGAVHCWGTLLPLSAGGAWVDYVYALVTFDGEGAKAALTPANELEAEPPVEAVAEDLPEEIDEPQVVLAEPENTAEPIDSAADEAQALVEITDEAEPLAEERDDDSEASGKAAPGFSKLFDNLVGLTGFYGHGYTVDPAAPVTFEPEQSLETPAAEEEPQPLDGADATIEDAAEAPQPEELELTEQTAPVALEGSLQNKLDSVRAKADEARQAKLRANVALYEGLSAAYDFALDAEDAPEEYLRLVEAEGLKIQLRSPMRPVVKLAFNGMCDDSTIRQLEAVLAWALDNELPRGSLADQIETAGGIGPILSGEAKAA